MVQGACTAKSLNNGSQLPGECLIIVLLCSAKAAGGRRIMFGADADSLRAILDAPLPEVTMNSQAPRLRKPLDPALKKYLEEIAAPASSGIPETAANRRTIMNRALESRTAIPGLPNRVESRDLTITARHTARLYTPPDAALPLPVLLYMHGGGWVVGSIATHDPFCRLLCGAAGIQILAIDFRLAPEYPFPASLNDTLAAWHWLVDHAEELGGDQRRFAVGGDSAGANLAAVSANRLSAAGDAVQPAAQLLLFPVTDHPSAGHPSYTECATGCGLDASVMCWFWEQYIQGVSPTDANISPLQLGEFPALPPTLVATAEHDPLRDEGIAYVDKLRMAGVEVTHLHYPDMHHNFPVHPGTVARFPQSVEALHQFAAWLKRTLE
jgi:acetyl esterase